LLFPEGENSWCIGMPLEGSCRQLSVRDFYAYHLHQRDDERETVFRARRLFQEYCCCAWSRVERQRLLYLKQNQRALRAENYNVIRDHMNFGDVTI
jgi:hypothetical protein